MSISVPRFVPGSVGSSCGDLKGHPLQVRLLGVESRPPTAATPQVTESQARMETLKRGAVQTLEGQRGGQEMEERRGRAILLPMCFEFRPGWTQC